MSFSTTGMKKTILYIITTLASFFPVVSFAALNGVKGLITDIGSIINSLIPVLFGLALIFFFWGLAQFILHSGEEKTREEGKQKMLWGIIALFVFISIMGILRFIGSTLDIPLGNGNNNQRSGSTLPEYLPSPSLELNRR